MSVESYLDSIRKNTQRSMDRTASLNSTIKDLLNYESLKRAIKDGVTESQRKEFKRLDELSEKILLASDATVDELKETNTLLRSFYAILPKNGAGTTSVSSVSLIQALKEVLDEFGDALPLKFQNRLRYDLVATAQNAGADPKMVFQQLNQTQVNQTVVIQNILEQLTDQQAKAERKAEAEEPEIKKKEKENKSFWENSIDKITGFLGNMVKNAGKTAAFLGAVYVGLGIFKSLPDSLKILVKGINNLLLTFSAANFVKLIGVAIGKLPFLKSISNWLGKSKVSQVAGAVGGAVKNLGGAAFAKIQDLIWGNDKLLDLITDPKSKFVKISGIVKSIAGWVGKAGQWIGRILKPLKMLLPALKILGGPVSLIIGVVTSLLDFIEGFNKTEGTLGQKILGGLKNVVVGFIKSIVDLIMFIPNLLIDWIKKAFNKMLPNFSEKMKDLGKAVIGVVLEVLKPLLSGFKGIYDAIAKYIEERPSYAASHPKINAATGTVDTIKSESSAQAVSGLNVKQGVVISDRMGAVLRDAGITETITSGFRMPTKSYEFDSKGKVKEGAHGSGNKVDIRIKDKDAAGLADLIGRLVSSPATVGVHVEGPGDPKGVGKGEWYTKYAQAMDILRGKGYKEDLLSKVKWWGSKYSDQPHIDYLIDRTKANEILAEEATGLNGIQTSASDVTVAKAEDVSNEQSVPNAKVLSPQSLLPLNNMVKQITTAPALAQALNPPPSFAKKDDITDPALFAQYLLNK